jgi:hypothetical protein
LEGFWSGGSGIPSLLTASFQADGTGHITGGEEDINDTISPQHSNFDTTAGHSLYTVGADHRGCLQLTNMGGTTEVFRFALAGIKAGIAGKGRIIEFDDNSGTGAGSRGSGVLKLQNPNSFVLTAVQGQYAFGVDGWGAENNQIVHFNTAGSFSPNSTIACGTLSGVILSGVYDDNFAGITSPESTGVCGNIDSISASTGRGTGSFDFLNWAIYIVNSSEFLVISTDPISSTVSAGKAIATSNSFTASSASGNYVVHMAGNVNGSGDVSLQRWSTTPGGGQTGTLSGMIFSYGGGSGAQSTPLTSVTYNVDPSTGRTTLGNPSDNLPILYLTTPADGISAFVLGMGSDAAFGFAEGQTSQTVATGSYAFGTEDPADNTVTDKSGAETIATGGVIAGTSDQSNRSGLNSGQTVTATVSLGTDGTGNTGPQTVAITTGTKLFSIDESGGTAGPAVIVTHEQ